MSTAAAVTHRASNPAVAPAVDPFTAGWRLGKTLAPLAPAAAAEVAQKTGPVDVAALRATLTQYRDEDAAKPAA